jgi:hypothetical protein
MRRLLGVLAAAVSFASPDALHGQVRFQDLVLNLGGGVDGYSGNLPAVTVLIVDSTDHATAVVGEVGVRGVLSLFTSPTRSLTFSFDGGMRQAAAVGFRLRDYAPREWVGSTSARLTQTLGSWGSLEAHGGVRGRSVEDRPPMPLFLQPGYRTESGGIGLATRPFGGVSFDARADVEVVEYLKRLDLLDRNSAGFELGVRWGGPSTIRFYGGLRWTDYNNQGSFDPGDPFRRDRTARMGLEWTYPGDVFAQFGLDGTLNRSNSNRPEYDAVSVRALLTAPLPRDFSLNIYSAFTFKSYVQDISFARLVPGEEADNASVTYLQIGHALASNLDGAVRFAWTRAETDIGDNYYRRFGGSIQFNYRPLGN